MIKDLKYKRILTVPQGSFFLFGPRGVGKSSWIAEQFKRDSNTFSIDLLSEATFQNHLANPGLFSQKLLNLPADTTVIIDEVQRLPNLLNEVHRFIEERGLCFILSGSSARKLRKAGTNLLAGRAVRKELFPLTPEELGTDFNLEKILRIGSLPLIWVKEGSRDVLESYVQTYLREEIQAEALVRNLPGFARFLPVASIFHSQVLNATALARDAGVSRSTVLGYLDILEDTLLCFRLRPFEGKMRVKETKHPKLYWIDSGIMRATKKRFGEVAEEERGFLFEGWIASLLRSYQIYRNLFDDWNFWSPTESSNLEVDFLLWKEDRCLALEVKSTSRWRSEYNKGLKAIKESWKERGIELSLKGVYLGEDHLKTEDGIEILPLKLFINSVERGDLVK